MHNERKKIAKEEKKENCKIKNYKRKERKKENWKINK